GRVLLSPPSGGFRLLEAFGSDRDVPDETQQFAADRGDRLIFVLSCRRQFAVALVQPVLRFPRDLFDFFAEVEIALPSEQVTTDPRASLISPRSLHDDSSEVSIAGLCDGAAFHLVAAGVFTGNQPAVPHQGSRLEAREAADLRYDRCRGKLCNPTQR